MSNDRTNPPLADFKSTNSVTPPARAKPPAADNQRKLPEPAARRPAPPAVRRSNPALALAARAGMTALIGGNVMTQSQKDRFHTKGWLAGMADRAAGLTVGADGRAEALNPGKRPEDRLSWMAGFTKAVGKKTASPA